MSEPGSSGLPECGAEVAPVVIARSGRAPFVLLAVIVLAGGVAFAVSNFFGSAGADSPEAAVEGLLGALGDEDLLGALEMILPAEGEVLRAGVLDLQGESERLGISEGIDPREVHGIDFEVDDYELAPTPLDDGVVEIRVAGGSSTLGVVIDQLPLSRATRAVIEDAMGADESTDELDDLRFVAVREGGGWYVSLGYTAAEHARRRSGAQLPRYGGSAVPVGGESPEDADRRMVDATIDLDVRTAIGLLPPDEMAAAYDYAPVFLEDLEARASEIGADRGGALELEDLEVVAEGSDRVRRVRIDQLALAWEDRGMRNEVTFDGECVEAHHEPLHPSDDDSSGYADRFCRDGSYASRDGGDGDWHEEEPPFGPLLPTIPDLALTVVQVDDRWYVSPMRTLIDGGLALFDGLEPADIDEWFAAEESDDRDGFCLVSCGSIQELVGSADCADCWDGPPVDGIDGCFAAAGDDFEDLLDEFDDPDAAWERVMYLQQEQLADCLDQLVEQGDADAAEVEALTDLTPCYSPYEGLTTDDPEERWAAADLLVTECLEQQSTEPPFESAWYGEPRVLAGLVLVPVGDVLTAVDPDTLEVMWESESCPYADWVTPYDDKDTPIAVVLCDGEYTGVEVATGELLWTHPNDGSAERTRVGNGVLVVQAGADLAVVDLTTGLDRWTVLDLGSANPAVDDQHVYASTDERIVAYDIQTGDELWSTSFGASGLRADESGVYARTSLPHLVRRLDPATGAIVWESEAEDDRLNWSDLVATNDSVVLALTRDEEDLLTVYSKDTGARLWTFDAGPDGSILVAAPAGAVAITDFVAGTVSLYDAQTGALREVLGETVQGVASGRGDLVAWIEIDEQGEQQLRVRRL